jgi:hypothetical protein
MTAGHADHDAEPARERRATGPSAFLFGAGHVIVHGNAAFVEEYGRAAVGLPAREALTDLPAAAFALLDRVLSEGRPLATRVTLRTGERRRLVAAPRRELESTETYGVVLHIRPVDSGTL